MKKHIFSLIALGILFALPAKSQEVSTQKKNTRQAYAQEWYGNLYVGYNLRTAALDPALLNPAEARSGLKIGLELKFPVGKKQTAVGIVAEYVTLNKLKSTLTENQSSMTITSNVNTLFIAPILTFGQPMKKGYIYEDFAIGYVHYSERMKEAIPPRTSPLKGTCNTLGYMISFGYFIKPVDFKLSFFSGSVSEIKISEDRAPVGSTSLAKALSFSSLSLTVGVHF